ncbi:ABC transporter substrate-binding protein, partial [Candidatus Aerophobetes bacterium]|nr:ABC transporter substrate-binding protein [Candidatus Aerophobetes bacterium]
APDRILVGSSAALGGPNAYLGTEFHKGAKLYFDQVNRQGGVYGRRIDTLVLDDGYEPDRTVSNTRKLIEEEKVDFLFGYIGTPTTVSILEMIEEKKIPLFAAFTGAEELRKPIKRYMINVRASYDQEIAGLVDHLLNYCGVERIACFYQDDPAGGIPIYAHLKDVLKTYGLALCGEGNYERNTVAIAEGFNQIRKSNPEAVMLVGEYAACGAFIEAAKGTEMENAYFCSISFIASDKLAALLGDIAEGVIFAGVVPNLEDERNSLTREFLTEYQKEYGDSTPNLVAYEGYISAVVFVEGLRRADKNLSRESFITGIEGIKNLDIGVGENINYGRFDHQGLDRVYYSIIENGKDVALTDWIQQVVK